VVLVRGAAETARSAVEKLDGIQRVRERRESDSLVRLEITFAKTESDLGAGIERVVAALVAAGIGVREAQPARATLEDVFATLTRAEVEETGERPAPAEEEPP
jgi:hypothetical protein